MASSSKKTIPIRTHDLEPVVETRPLSDIDAALMTAARSGNIDTAQSCIHNGADVNCHKDDGVTPLFLAAEVGHRRMVHFLITLPSTDPNIPGTFNRTPINVAATFGFLTTTKMLLRHDADPNIGDEFGKTPLHNSIKACNLPMTTLLVRHGADVNQPDRFGNMPLYLAMIEMNNPDQSRFLLRNGALPNLQGPRGDAILFDCVLNLDPSIQNEVVHMLIRYGARVNIGNQHTRKTPLHSCAYFNNIELAEFLLHMGANPKAASYTGVLPMDLAAGEKNWEIYNQLEDAIFGKGKSSKDDDERRLSMRTTSSGVFATSSILKKPSTEGSKGNNRVKFAHALRARTKASNKIPGKDNSKEEKQSSNAGAKPSSDTKVNTEKSENLNTREGKKQDVKKGVTYEI